MVFATKRRRPNVAGEVEIQAKELRYEKQIGDGGFATVFLGKCNLTIHIILAPLKMFDIRTSGRSRHPSRYKETEAAKP
jgi:hypothetical protein